MIGEEGLEAQPFSDALRHCRPHILIPLRWAVATQNPDDVGVDSVALAKESTVDARIVGVENDRSDPPQTCVHLIAPRGQESNIPFRQPCG